MIHIKLASLQQCLDIMSEPHLLTALGIEDSSKLEGYILSRQHPFYLAQTGKYRLLFQCWARDNGIYSFHVACPKSSIRGSRTLVLAAMSWVLDTYKQDLKALTTECPEGKMANLCRKLGAIEIKSFKDRVHFMVTPSYFKSKL
jgi:hypothetical protein